VSEHTAGEPSRVAPVSAASARIQARLLADRHEQQRPTTVASAGFETKTRVVRGTRSASYSRQRDQRDRRELHEADQAGSKALRWIANPCQPTATATICVANRADMSPEPPEVAMQHGRRHGEHG
jgi:hypothetical protein